MITETAAGKVMLSGEWGVLDPDCGCIVLPTECTVKAEIIPQDDFEIDLASIQLPVCKAQFFQKQFNWMNPDISMGKAEFVRRAIEVSLQILLENQIVIQPFYLKTYGFDFYAEKKLGLGSSAAIVVATIKAILKLHQYPFNPELIYKLAVIAHYLTQNKLGSGFDVAASAYNKALHYKRFEPDCLENEIKQKKPMKELVQKTWSGLLFQEFHKPKDLIVLVGWTGEPASTVNLIEKFNQFKADSLNDWKDLLSKINRVVEQILNSVADNNNLLFLQSLQQNHQILLELNNFMPIYTDKLKALVDIAEQNYFAGKLSGAGGGDCGIAVGFDRDNVDLIKRQWKQVGIEFLFEL